MKLRLLLIGLLTLITSVTFASELSNWKPLLSVDKLHELLEEDPFAATVVDIRALDAKEPDASYNAGHIPGAISSPYATWRGQPDNPGKFITQDKLTWLVQALGAEVDTPVVVVHRGDSYSDFGAAARVYWSLKTAGLTNLAILNGASRPGNRRACRSRRSWKLHCQVTFLPKSNLTGWHRQLRSKPTSTSLESRY